MTSLSKITDIVYDESGCLYKYYDKLVMAGYQGWFAAQGDDSRRGWYHNDVSVLLGVPYYWRTLGRDTENNPALHALIKKCDILMPWAVGRYKIESYDSTIVAADVKWAEVNGVDYVPLVFPGFSWGNLQKDTSLYNETPRVKGDLLWKQIAGAKQAGAKSLYVAMFDEIDEGTAIYKVLNQKNVPLNGSQGGKFIGIEDDLPTDYYLWLTGQGAKWFHNEGSYGIAKPVR